MLYCIDQLWLRLALETVFDEEIAIVHDDDYIPIITAFIAHRLFRDPLILKNPKCLIGK